jgi:signal transduction histidine kinase
VFRHSRASKACVTLEKREKEIATSIHDDGIGVREEISEFRHNSIGVGIGGMRQRIKELGGELFLRNTRPGSIVEVIIPVPSMQSELQAVPAISSSSSSSSPKLKAKGTSTGFEQGEL